MREWARGQACPRLPFERARWRRGKTRKPVPHPLRGKKPRPIQSPGLLRRLTRRPNPPAGRMRRLPAVAPVPMLSPQDRPPWQRLNLCWRPQPAWPSPRRPRRSSLRWPTLRTNRRNRREAACWPALIFWPAHQQAPLPPPSVIFPPVPQPLPLLKPHSEPPGKRMNPNRRPGRRRLRPAPRAKPR